MTTSTALFYFSGEDYQNQGTGFIVQGKGLCGLHGWRTPDIADSATVAFKVSVENHTTMAIDIAPIFWNYTNTILLTGLVAGLGTRHRVIARCWPAPLHLFVLLPRRSILHQRAFIGDDQGALRSVATAARFLISSKLTLTRSTNHADFVQDRFYIHLLSSFHDWLWNYSSIRQPHRFWISSFSGDLYSSCNFAAFD